jgi:integrase
MARVGRSARITTPADRRRLYPRPAIWWRRIEPGLALGYRRALDRPALAGTWYARLCLPGGIQHKTTFGTADDHAEADGRSVLTFAQAQAAAVAWARRLVAGEDRARPHTVRDALLAYRDAKLQAGQHARAAEVTTLLDRHVAAVLADVPIANLAPTMLRAWVAGLRNRRKEAGEGVRLTQSRIDGLRGVMKAALRAADAAPILLQKGLGAHTTAAATGSPREAPAARKAVLDRAQITALLSACDDDLRLFCRVLDVTGARPSQIARLTVDDLDWEKNRILIPRSAKGRPGSRKPDAIAFPLPQEMLAELARRSLSAAAGGLLLHRPERKRLRPGVWQIVGRAVWTKNTWTRPFRAAAAAAGLPASTTIYALRHSRIVAMLLGGLAAQAVAAQLDTSEPMLRRHYARWIGHYDPVQAQIRALQAMETAPTLGPVHSLLMPSPVQAQGRALQTKETAPTLGHVHLLLNPSDPVQAQDRALQAQVDPVQAQIRALQAKETAPQAQLRALQTTETAPTPGRVRSLLTPSRRQRQRNQRMLKDIDRADIPMSAPATDQRTP